MNASVFPPDRHWLLKFTASNWKWLLGVFVAVITAYNMIYATAKDTKLLKDDMADMKQFQAVQLEINTVTKEGIKGMNEKLDKILFRIPRR